METTLDQFMPYELIQSVNETSTEEGVEPQMRILQSDPKQTTYTPKMYHKFLLSPRSYYSKSIIQEYDKELTTIAEFVEDENDDDELMDYFFDNLKQVLFRRGKKTLKVFTMSNPLLRIRLSDTLLEDTTAYENKDKAHECGNSASLSLKYKAEIGSSQLVEDIHKICVAPELQLSSMFKNNLAQSTS
jgi:hypothetical protein